MLTACDRADDFTAPSFIHIDGVKITAAQMNDIAYGDQNFYTSDVVGVYVVAHYPEKMTVDTIGLYTLPFTAPVLYDGEVDYLEISPAVMVSGVSGMLTFYTFYNRIYIRDTVLHSGDTLNLGILSTCYNTQTDAPKLFEPFEPTEGGVATDETVEWVPHDRDNACTGEGYGRVHVKADQGSVSFALVPPGSNDHFIFPDPTKYYYLELDIKSDVEVKLWMHAAYTSGGNEDKLSVMNMRPTNGEWRHFYITLGRTWKQFNRPAEVNLSFSALNTEGIEGDVLLDNIKLLSTSVMF